MIQATVTPHEEDFMMSISLPAHYMGKEVHVLFYTDDEVKQTTATLTARKKPSDFFGILTKEEGIQLDVHIQQMRGEWDRNI